MRTIHITVELSRSPRRMWIKAVENDGKAIVLNVAADQALRERNRLIDRLIKGGEFDQVTAGEIPKRGQAPRMP